jgi:Protein of unknown function (DUF1569)
MIGGMKSLASAQDQHEILTRLKAIQPSSRRRWGRMSPHQMICHLGDAFRMFMSEKRVALGPPWYQRPLLKWLALWAPVPWPRGFKAAPDLDQQIDGTPPADFEDDMRALYRLIGRFTRQPRDHDWQCHPHFGRMSDRAWMRLAYLHTDHHLRQFGA